MSGNNVLATTNSYSNLPNKKFDFSSLSSLGSSLASLPKASNPMEVFGIGISSIASLLKMVI